MSYTAPQYVDTKEQAILALASTIAGEDKTALGNGSVNKAGAILALAQYAQGGGGSSTQTLTVTKANGSDTVSVWTQSWAGYIAGGYDESVNVQPDSTDGLTSVYSIPVGAYFDVHINNDLITDMYLTEEISQLNHVETIVMPSTPLYVLIDNQTV